MPPVTRARIPSRSTASAMRRPGGNDTNRGHTTQSLASSTGQGGDPAGHVQALGEPEQPGRAGRNRQPGQRVLVDVGEQPGHEADREQDAEGRRRARRRGVRRAAGSGRRAGGGAGRDRSCRPRRSPVSRSRSCSGDRNGTLPGRGAAEVGEPAAFGCEWAGAVQQLQPGGGGEAGDGVGIDDGPAEPGAVVRAPARGGPGRRRQPGRGRPGASTSATTVPSAASEVTATAGGGGRGRRRSRCCRRPAGSCASGPPRATGSKTDRCRTAAPRSRARAHGGRGGVDAERHRPPPGEAQHEPARAAADVEDGRGHRGQERLLLGGWARRASGRDRGEGRCRPRPGGRPVSQAVRRHQATPASETAGKRPHATAGGTEMGAGRRRRRRGRRWCRCRVSGRPGGRRNPAPAAGIPGPGRWWRRSSGCRRTPPGDRPAASR